MPPAKKASERAALAVYLPLVLVSIALLVSGPLMEPLWLARAVSVLYLPFRGASVTVGHLTSLLMEQERFKSEEVELTRARSQLRMLREENDRLRDLLSFGRRDSLRLIPAWVLAKRIDPLGTRIIVNRGNGDGVRLGNPVVNEDGLVGRVDAL